MIVGVPSATSSLPQGEPSNPSGVAVIIGNQTYENERVPEVSYAQRDADAFKHSAERHRN